MQVSWKALQSWVPCPKPSEVAEILTRRGIEVETIEDRGAGLDQVVVARILDLAKHPEADRLTLCGVTFGGDRSEIVCGAKNMKVGDCVALALPGARLPNGAKIEKSKIRGVTSNGMLCSEVELGLASESEGILILQGDPRPGDPIVKVLNRDDAILHLKPTANRGDCLGMLGIAREVAAATGAQVCRPEGRKITVGKEPSVAIGSEGVCTEFLLARMVAVKVGPSPKELSDRLEGYGVRAINNVVDCANLTMFELGHPVHTYDAGKIQGTLTARTARSGERMVLLDERDLALQEGDGVIADARGPVALAGVMGGKSSEVSESTVELLLEVAVFPAKAVRRSIRSHALRSDAGARFERGIDPTDTEAVMGRLAWLLEKFAGGRLQGVARAGRGAAPRVLEISQARLSRLLEGSAIARDSKKQAEILSGLGVGVQASGETWKFSIPGHRPDLEIAEDIAEEIVRTVGFESFASVTPPLAEFPRLDPKFEMTLRTKRLLAGLGLNETISYAFTSRATLRKYCGEWADSAVGIANPMSEDQEALVPSLLPGLMGAYLTTRAHQFGSQKSPVGFFEVRPVFSKSDVQPGKTVTGVLESERLGILLAGSVFESAFSQEQRAADARDLAGVIETLFDALQFRGSKIRQGEEIAGYGGVFHPGACASHQVGKQRVAVFGELSPALLGTLKVREKLFFAEIEMGPIGSRSLEARERTFRAPREHPPGERDFAFLVPDSVSAGALVDLLRNEGRPIVESAHVFDRYAGDQVPKGMTSVALRVIFSVEGRSPTESEIDQVVAKLLTRSQEVLGVRLRDR